MKRWTRVDPYATSAIGRESRLSAVETWTLHLMAIQAEWRSSEWTGTLTDLASDTRFSRKAVHRAIEGLYLKGRLREIEPFRQGTEGRVLIVDHDRIVNLERRKKIESNDPNSVGSDPNRNETGLGAERDRKESIDSIGQAKQGSREVKRHRGREVSDEKLDDGPRCGTCQELIAGHPFTECEPEPSIITSHFPDAVDVTKGEYELRRETERP